MPWLEWHLTYGKHFINSVSRAHAGMQQEDGEENCVTGWSRMVTWVWLHLGGFSVFFGLQVPLHISPLSTEERIQECSYTHFIEFKGDGSVTPWSLSKSFVGVHSLQNKSLSSSNKVLSAGNCLGCRRGWRFPHYSKLNPWGEPFRR